MNAASSHLRAFDLGQYVLHNFEPADEKLERLDPQRRLSLQIYSRDAEARPGLERWNNVTLFDQQSRVLYQPWGTNLLPEEFHAPLPGNIRRAPFSFWVGSIWNNALNQGNRHETAQLRAGLRKAGKHFVKVRFIPNCMNTALVRHSSIAPAIAGGWQAENGYLPCRMFKNISYGHLGLSNGRAFDKVLGDASMPQKTIGEITDATLSLDDNAFVDRIAAQQAGILDHTYDKKLLNFVRAFAA
jgi:hypothetical protein